jgi:hypothetical protein
VIASCLDPELVPDAAGHLPVPAPELSPSNSNPFGCCPTPSDSKSMIALSCATAALAARHSPTIIAVRMATSFTASA